MISPMISCGSLDAADPYGITEVIALDCACAGVGGSFIVFGAASRFRLRVRLRVPFFTSAMVIMYTHKLPGTADPMDRRMFSSSGNRSELSYINNLTDPIQPRVSNDEFSAGLARQRSSYILVRSDGRDLAAYPNSNVFRVGVGKNNVSRVSITTCVFSGSTPPPGFILLSVSELGKSLNIQDTAGSPSFDASFPLLLKETSPGTYAADNHIQLYSIEFPQPLPTLRTMSFTFRDGVTSELITANHWSVSIVFNVLCSTPDEC